MTRQNLDAWVPEERGSEVLNVVNSTSAVEALARRENMNSETKLVKRAGGVDVSVTPKGTAYTESDSVDSEVLLTARKFTGLIRIAEEDLDDIPENIVALRQRAWANTYAKTIDNAVLGVTAAETGTDVAPFTSVYRTLSQADATTGYVANTNIIKTAGAVTYEDFSAVIGLLEESDYFGDLVVIAHPHFKGALRSVKDASGAPIFLAGVNNTPDTIFGYQLVFSAGAKTSATNTDAPTGNPLLVVAEKSNLIFGVRSGPESAVVQGFNSQSITDEALIKMRARRAFVLGNPNAAAILEVTAAV